MPTPSLAPTALYTMGPFEVVGPVGESGDPFPELHAALDKSMTANTTVRMWPLFEITDICAFRRSPSTRRPAIGLARRLAQGLRLCKNCAPTMTMNPARPWTRFYHPS